MIQYIIYAKDSLDENAPVRRQNVRAAHLEGVKKLIDNGNYILGGALVAESGQMIGSTLILQFDNDHQLEHWKASEVYIQQDVWERIEINKFKMVDFSQLNT